MREGLKLPERFYSKSPQTEYTPTVKHFIGTVFPAEVRGKEDLEQLLEAVKREIPFKKDLAEVESFNPELNESLDIAKENREDMEHPEIHALVPGVRSAEEIIEDGFVSHYYPCTDYNTVIMAVLRAKGIKCRLTRIISQKAVHQTCFTELELGEKHYRVHPVKEGLTGPEIKEGLLQKERAEQRLITSEDHETSGINLYNLITGLNRIRGKP